MEGRKPNIVLINCDDLGYGDIACYGSLLNKTPIINEMALQGIKFTSFYMASAVCSPSRGSMMCGCYPNRIGFGDFEGRSVLFPGQGVGLNPSEITIAKLLKGVGYKSKLVGKWHCGDQSEFLPTNHGFDEYFGLPYSNDMGIQVGGNPDYPPLPLIENEQVMELQPNQETLTERYVEEAVKFIKKNKENPFFLYFAHMYVHLPIYVPKRFENQSNNGDYGAAVACIDWVAGEILNELRQQGLEENTLVIFTSDNGSRGSQGGSNYPLRGQKTTTWEGGFRVPCIMYWKGVIPAGTECDEIVSSLDFYTTIAKLAGAKLPLDRVIDGLDISPLMFGESGAKSPHKAFFYYYMSSLEAVREGDWKLHVRKANKEVQELYNLHDDVGETTNLYNDNPKIVQRLNKLLIECREDLGDVSIGMIGKNIRPIGRALNPKYLSNLDPNHPYVVAMYDKNDIG